MSDFWRIFKAAGAALAAIALLTIAVYTAYSYGQKRNAGLVAELATKLSSTKQTLEITEGLYSKEVVRTTELRGMLDISSTKLEAMKRVIDETQAKLLVAEQVSLGWKKAYEKLLDATQTEEPPDEGGGPVRKRVDFSGKLGPIQATGHTLTDPPEAFLKLEQVDPLTLTMTMVQNKDETWSTYVTSSDPNVDVKIDLAGVNPLILKERWYQRLWIDGGVTFLGDPSGTLGLSYHGDRFSFGVNCSAWQTGNGCGVSGGYRIFK